MSQNTTNDDDMITPITHAQQRNLILNTEDSSDPANLGEEHKAFTTSDTREGFENNWADKKVDIFNEGFFFMTRNDLKMHKIQHIFGLSLPKNV